MFNKIASSLVIAAVGFFAATAAAEAGNHCGFNNFRHGFQQTVFCGNHCGSNLQTFGNQGFNNFHQVNFQQQGNFQQQANFHGFNNGQVINVRQQCIRTF